LAGVDYRTLFENIHRRPGLYGLDGSYAQFCAFVSGVDHGNDGALLTGFREWLVTRAGKGNNLTWPALVRHLAFPGTDRPAAAPTDSPQTNQAAADRLFALLAEFFDLRAEHGGVVKIFDGYLAWLRTQSWYEPG
jgi:hypothetical protein